MKKIFITVLVLVIILLISFIVPKPKQTPTPASIATSTIPNTDNNTPHITSISQSSGPIGTILEIKGENLAGFEGDLDAMIENIKGEPASLSGIGSVPRENKTIRVKIESKICKVNTSYKGGSCPEYLEITPGIYFIYANPWGNISNKVQFTVTKTDQTVLTLYVQDKEVAKTSDCRVTYPISYQVPKTTAIADASLKILFGGELSQYGFYKSVSVTNGIAKVMLQSDLDPAGKPIGALSSCESGHLMAVLHDTLTQYPTITSVELFSPKGKINF